MKYIYIYSYAHIEITSKETITSKCNSASVIQFLLNRKLGPILKL